MKKNKFLIAVIATVLFSTAAFADGFKWSDCWCTYGAGIEPGNIIVDVGVGLPYHLVDGDFSRVKWFIPAAEASLEKPVMIWKLPFSFGGSVYYSSKGTEYDEVYETYSHRVAVAGLVKYHFHLPPENLDLYAGFKAGVDFDIYGEKVGNNDWDTGLTPYFYHSELLGASWYFSKNFGVNAEFGFPIFCKAGISLKF